MWSNDSSRRTAQTAVGSGFKDQCIYMYVEYMNSTKWCVYIYIDQRIFWFFLKLFKLGWTYFKTTDLCLSTGANKVLLWYLSQRVQIRWRGNQVYLDHEQGTSFSWRIHELCIVSYCCTGSFCWYILIGEKMKGTRNALKTFESTDTMRYVHSKRLCDMNAVLL